LFQRESVERSKFAILMDKTDGSGPPDDNERQSDHILMMIAYRKWERILRQASLQFFKASFFFSLYCFSNNILFETFMMEYGSEYKNNV